MEKVSKKFIDNIHKYILKGLKPDFTFILTVNIKKAMNRLKKKKIKIVMINSHLIFIKSSKAFIKISKNNKKIYAYR